METMRLILIFLHTLIIIFSAVDLHSHLNRIAVALNHEQRISAIIHYITELFCISFYHTISILAVWFSRRYGAGIIRASGILLIGELLQVMTSVIQLTIETNHVEIGEISFIVIFDFLLLTTLLMTFQLAKKVSRYQENLMQIELLADTVHDMPIDNNVKPTFT
jgi:hypothetical protein